MNSPPEEYRLMASYRRVEAERHVMDEDELHRELKERWLRLAVRYGAHHTVVEKLYDTIARAYSEPWRRYHTLRHIGSMLDFIAAHGAFAEDRTALDFAAWFHDIIYDTRRSDNEERSADFAANILLALMAPEKIALRVAALILLTKHHVPPPDDAEAALFIDADLAVLGADPSAYRTYRESIRLEYSWVDEIHYRHARRKVLEEFLAHERIYFTPSVHKRLEAQARINLGEEIADLSGRD